ncbi:nucleotidyl transferase AbiEii/AbiGii toxin family protein [Algoriphagus yeomjeoni]|uniref:nucleotidyl transferase AbiEii/AbiGii toxin family protein n=1 Tax=Algoriphagus yeomjeoni TaxID=291403 RepID=UPI003CE4A2EF
MIQEWIEQYNPKTQEDYFAAIREIMQDVALAGLQRAAFFEKAAFYGGTALRVFYGLDRYSEDLDFSLLKKDSDFSLEVYFEAIITEFEAIGMNVRIMEKKKQVDSSIDSAFLKSATVWKELELQGIVPQAGVKHMPTIKIKIEVDREPPLGFETEEKLLLRPFSFYVKCFTPPSLFAGKMHALLFRKWKNRVKGRDWYDMEWYIKKGILLDLNHFLHRARDTGDWHKETITKEEFINLLISKISTVDFGGIRVDVVRFIPNESVIAIWSRQYFTDLIKKLKFYNS